MYRIAIVAEKGGVGKTTIALNLAVAAVQKRHSVVVIDVDAQATASKWTDRRKEEHPWIVPTHAARIGATIEKARAQGVNFVIIDTPPHSSSDAAEAARNADLVLVPVEPHLFTLETLPKLADLLKLAGNTPGLFVVSKAATQGSEGTQTVEYMKAQGLSVCPIILYMRAAHRHATNIGKGTLEYEADSKASQELLQLYMYTIQFVDTLRKMHAKIESAHART